MASSTENDREAESLFRTAQAMHDNDRDGEAIDTLTSALDLRPDYADALELRGFLYLLEGQPEQAFADLTRVLQLTPQSVAARGLRGEVYRQLRQPDEAIRDFTEAIRMAPSNRPAYVSRGKCYMNRKDYPRALADFTVALRLRATADVHNERAACYYFTADHAGAIADHTAALAMEPNDHASCNYLAWILATCPTAALRNGARAVELATKACELTQYQAPGYIDTLAAAFAETGHFAEAVREMERAMALVEGARLDDYRTRFDLYRAGKAYHTE